MGLLHAELWVAKVNLAREFRSVIIPCSLFNHVERDVSRQSANDVLAVLEVNGPVEHGKEVERQRTTVE